VPERIRLSRAKGWRKPVGAAVVSRPSRWGNPFPVDGDEVPDRAASVARYRAWAATDPPELADVEVLRGRDLACWCPLDGPCHADVLLELANRPGAFAAGRDDTAPSG
jgi:hypothetical protein